MGENQILEVTNGARKKDEEVQKQIANNLARYSLQTLLARTKARKGGEPNRPDM